MGADNTLNRLVYLFQNLVEIETRALERNLGEAYFLKSINTELREIIMIFHLSTDLLRTAQYIKEEHIQEYYTLVYEKINEMRKNIDKNTKAMQTLCTYIKDSNALAFVDDAIQLSNLIVNAIEKTIDTGQYREQ